ncbi:MAG TPA: GGDEF domain-containing protein [Candidatus Angelobacter sp.]|nr:GGDEF domain-containing protein [Candidatus Angelobacter sp.]
MGLSSANSRTHPTGISLLLASLKVFYRLAVPGGLLLFLAAALMRYGNGVFYGAPGRQGQFYAPLILSVGVVLSVLLGRTRVFLALIFLLVTERMLDWAVPQFVSPDRTLILDAIVASLFAVNLLILSFTGDSSLLSKRTQRHLAFIALQVVAISLLTGPFGAETAAVSGSSLVTPHLFTWSRLPQLSLLVFALAAVVMAVRLVRRYESVESGLFWALMASFLAFKTDGTPQSGIYFSTAGVVLVLSVLETSYLLIYRDEETNLPNRRSLLNTVRKAGEFYSIGRVGVDNIKQLINLYGEAQGLQALRMIALNLTRVAGGGKVFRYSHQEFVVFFTDKSAAEAVPLLDTIRKIVERSPFTVRGGHGTRLLTLWRRKKDVELGITISIGIAERDIDRPTGNYVLQAAGKALDRARAKGRNCTVISAPSRVAGRSSDFSTRVLSVE